MGCIWSITTSVASLAFTTLPGCTSRLPVRPVTGERMVQ